MLWSCRGSAGAGCAPVEGHGQRILKPLAAPWRADTSAPGEGDSPPPIHAARWPLPAAACLTRCLKLLADEREVGGRERCLHPFGEITCLTVLVKSRGRAIGDCTREHAKRLGGRKAKLAALVWLAT
jgi:hypothetical protein